MLTASTEPLPEISNPASASAGKGRSEPGRLLGLDLLRLVAVTLVICRHLKVTGDSWPSRILNVAARGGGTGVDIFFALSGFLVSGLLFREYQKNGEVRIGRFLIRRGLKIYPPLWMLIIFSLLLWDFGLWEGFSRKGLLGETLFLQNYIGGLWFNTWSLGIEEHFYLLLAAVVFVSIRFIPPKRSPTNPFSFVPKLFVIMAVVCLIARIIRWHLHSADFIGSRVIFPSDCRLDALMFGVLLSYWWHFSPENRFREAVRRWRGALALIGILGLAPAFIWECEYNAPLCVFGVMSFSLGAGGLILSILSIPNLERFRLLKCVGRLGAYSYSAYLWHAPLMIFLMEPYRALWSDWLQFLISFSATWIVGIVAARLVEIPVLHLRDRYFPAHVPNLKQAPSWTNAELSVT